MVPIDDGNQDPYEAGEHHQAINTQNSKRLSHHGLPSLIVFYPRPPLIFKDLILLKEREVDCIAE